MQMSTTHSSFHQ